MVKVRVEILYRSDSISLFLQQLIAHVDTPSETVSIFLSPRFKRKLAFVKEL